MKVAIAAAGRFHAIRLAQQMEKRNLLERLYSGSVLASDYQVLSQHRVTSVYACQLIDIFYNRLRMGKFIPASIVNRFKDNWFDATLKKEVASMPFVDIFVVWAHYCRWSMPQIKKKSRVVIVESGSSHILEQERLLQKEYDAAGLKAPPILQENKEKMCAEYEMTNYIMTPSQFVYDGFVRQGVPACKLLKVACGADIDFFYDEHQRRSDTVFRVVFVGLVCLRKGIRLLLQAWKKIKQELDQFAELVIVGSIQHDVKKLVAQYQDDNSIVFMGPLSRDDLKHIYKTATLFVLPSIEDGFGMVMGEAMASGLSVVCTQNTGGPDIIRDGIEGRIIAAGDVQVLAEALLWSYLHREELLVMGIQAQKKSKELGWDTYGDSVYDVYRNLVGE